MKANERYALRKRMTPMNKVHQRWYVANVMTTLPRMKMIKKNTKHKWEKHREWKYTAWNSMVNIYCEVFYSNKKHMRQQCTFCKALSYFVSGKWLLAEHCKALNSAVQKNIYRKYKGCNRITSRRQKKNTRSYHKILLAWDWR